MITINNLNIVFENIGIDAQSAEMISMRAQKILQQEFENSQDLAGEIERMQIEPVMLAGETVRPEQIAREIANSVHGQVVGQSPKPPGF